MLYAVSNLGTGRYVSFREVQEGWPLNDGERLVTTDPSGKVFDADGVTLRDPTPAERAAADAAPVNEREAALDALLEAEAAKPAAPQAVKDYVSKRGAR